MKISIITATKNSLQTINDNVNSFRMQFYSNKEQIIMDCLSCDGTLELLRVYGDDLRIISEADTGIYNAINKGIEICSGEIVGLLHSDDVFAHNDILSMVATEFIDPLVNVVYGNLSFVERYDVKNISRDWVSSSYRKGLFYHGWMPPHTTMFIRKNVFEKIGGYNEDFSIAGDYEFILRLFRFGYFDNSVYLNEKICIMRNGGKSNGSFSAFYIKLKEDYLALRINGFNSILALYIILFKKLRKLNQFKIY